MKIESDSELSKRAMALMDAGEHDQGIELFTHALNQVTSAKDRAIKQYMLAQAFLISERYDEAVDGYTRAVDDATDDLGFMVAMAHYNKAEALLSLRRFGEAAVAYEDAHDSMEGGMSLAVHRKGRVLLTLGEFEKAANTFKDAELASELQRFPAASADRAGTLVKLGKLSDAELSARKALEDATLEHYAQDNSVYEEMHLLLSKIHSARGDTEKARLHAFKSFDHNNINIDTISYLLESFSNEETKPFYTNRLDFIVAEFAHSIYEGNLGAAHRNRHLFGRFLSDAIEQDHQPLSFFINILKIECVSFPEKISMPDRFRVAYLLHLLTGEVGYAFRVLDQDLDTKYQLNSMDYFFYLLTSYLIGQPLYELEYFLKEVTATDDNDIFSDHFFNLKSKIGVAIARQNNLDPNLLDLGSTNLLPSRLEVNEAGQHPWVTNVLSCLLKQQATGDSQYTVPLSALVLKGLATQLITQAVESIELTEISRDTRWVNFENSLLVRDANGLDYTTLINNTRDAIRNGIPYTFLLARLFQEFETSTSVITRHNLTIVQAAVMISENLERLGKGANDMLHVEVPATSLLDVAAQEFLRGVVTLSFAGTYGLSLAAAVASRILSSLYGKRTISGVNRVFADLSRELRAE